MECSPSADAAFCKLGGLGARLTALGVQMSAKNVEHQALRLARLNPAIDPVVADATGGGHVGPGPEAFFFLAAELGEQRLLAGRRARSGRSGPTRALAQSSLVDKGLEGRPQLCGV